MNFLRLTVKDVIIGEIFKRDVDNELIEALLIGLRKNEQIVNEWEKPFLQDLITASEKVSDNFLKRSMIELIIRSDHYAGEEAEKLLNVFGETLDEYGFSTPELFFSLAAFNVSGISWTTIRKIISKYLKKEDVVDVFSEVGSPIWNENNVREDDALIKEIQ
jgi:hypothetical protein